MNGHTTRLTAADGHVFDAYEVHPEGAAAAVVIVQEIFGVNEHIRSVADRYAALGYHAIAPALFDRAESGVELRYDAEGIRRAAGTPSRSGGTRRWPTSPPRSPTRRPPGRSR